MWQKENDNTDRTWQEVLTYCEGLALAYYSNWRLSNIKELRSAADNTKFVPAIDTTYFPHTRAYCWSSTTYAYNSVSAWLMDVNVGLVGFSFKLSKHFFGVRCIR